MARTGSGPVLFYGEEKDYGLGEFNGLNKATSREARGVR